MGILARSVADVAAFGIGNAEVLGIALQVRGDARQSLPALRAEGFKKGQVGLVGHRVFGGRVDDGAAEVGHSLCIAGKCRWQFG